MGKQRRQQNAHHDVRQPHGERQNTKTKNPHKAENDAKGGKRSEDAARETSAKEDEQQIDDQTSSATERSKMDVESNKEHKKWRKKKTNCKGGEKRLAKPKRRKEARRWGLSRRKNNIGGGRGTYSST